MLTSFTRWGLLTVPLLLAAGACGDDDPGEGSDGGAGAPNGGAATGDAGGSSENPPGGSSSVGTAGDANGGQDGVAGAVSGGGGYGSDASGAGGGGGSSEGGAGGAGPQLDALSTSCDDFEATITMGPTFVVGQVGAVLCFSLADGACRLTTNTYIDGTNPCPDADRLLTFFGDTVESSYRLYGGSPPDLTVEITNLSSGTIDEEYPNNADVDEGASVTATLEAEGRTFEVIFELNDDALTLTSFEEVL